MYKIFFKRLFDLILSGFAIICLSPLFLVLTVVGVFAMKGNPYFIQARPGKNEKMFNMIKFRTMTNEKDDEGKLLPDLLRESKYGDFLRKLSLDELPELFNIFCGQMSIVGPRPLLERYLPFYTKEEHHRHDVRPGLTGLAQINGRNYISWEEIFKLDLEYVNEVSIKLDIRIIMETVKKVIKRSDVSDATQGAVDSKGKRVHDALDIERG